MEVLRSRQWSVSSLEGGLTMVDQHVEALKRAKVSDEAMLAELHVTCQRATTCYNHSCFR